LVSDNCEEYDNGFYRNGLRATQFRFITFWQSLAQRFLKDPMRNNSRILSNYKYDMEISNTINGQLKYTNKAVADLISTFDEERKGFTKAIEGISWGKAMGMIVILIIAFIFVFLNFLSQLKEEISLTKAMMKMIPEDLLQANPKLLRKVLRGSS